MDLGARDSRRYITDEHFRAETNPDRQQVRLNLGADDIRMYMIDAEFRKSIDALVQDPRKQIWSDVLDLNLSPSFFSRSPGIDNINQLASLVNLERLDLSRHKVKNIRPLLCLPNLKFVNLSGTPAALDTRWTCLLEQIPGLTIKK